MLLIAEDDAALGALLQEYFNALDYGVIWTQRGDEALEMVTSMRFDLVLSDIVMPGADGMMLLERIGKDHARTLVILMTGYSAVTDALDAVQKGAWDFVSKPFQLPELQVRVDNARRYQQTLRKNRQLEAEVRHLREQMARLSATPSDWARRAYGTDLAG